MVVVGVIIFSVVEGPELARERVSRGAADVYGSEEVAWARMVLSGSEWF